MKTAYLIKDRQERFNMRGGWFVNAYRIVDINNRDLVQPWFNKKKEAIEYAKGRYTLVDKTKT